MKYRGLVKNGVVEFQGKPPLEEGTVVEVEAVEAVRPRRGSAEAVLRWSGVWKDQAEDFDRLMAELREMKQAELKAQIEREQSEPEPGL